MLNNLISTLRNRQDLMLVGVLMVTIVLMIIPVPTYIVDFLIGLNISLTVLILSVSVYLKRPDSFSTFPSIILFGTAFRLAISISTTRLILSEADAGEIIETFGTFVTSGNVIVGMVVFLIITTVQFLVVTKGGERVAEVAARFVLDAMPGRQMSIDAEVRAGDISPEEAKQARRKLDRENKFYGAMDGAMKFIKGDAIAGLIIIAVNLLGGIAVGMLQRGLSFSEAIDTYSRLTIGDGLVAQIPALLMALCAGTIITRIADDNNEDLGSDISNQLTGDSRTLGISAFVIAAIGFVPGFPTLVFWAIAALLLMVTLAISRRERALEEPTIVDMEEIEEAEVLEQTAHAEPSDQIIIRAGSDLYNQLNTETFIGFRIRALRWFRFETGVDINPYGLLQDVTLDQRALAIDLENVPLLTTKIPAGYLVAQVDGEIATLADIDALPVGDEVPIKSGMWVPLEKEAMAQESSIKTFPVEWLINEVVIHYLHANISDILRFEDAQKLLREISNSNPQLAEHIGQTMTPTKLLDVLRRLVGEGVSITSRRLLFGAIAEHCVNEEDPVMLTELVRLALRRQISKSLADENGVISAYIIEPVMEQRLRESINHTEAGPYLMMSADLASRLLVQVDAICEPKSLDAPKSVIATATDLRRHIRAYLAEHNIQTKVISFQEVPPEFHLHTIGTIDLDGDHVGDESEKLIDY